MATAKARVIELFPVAQRTGATYTSESVCVDAYDDLTILTEITTRTAGTITASLQGSNDETTWVEMVAMFSAVSAATDQWDEKAAPLPKYVRVLVTQATSPDFVWGMKMNCKTRGMA